MVETVEPRGSRDEKHVLCAFIYGAACHRESRPGHRDPCGGWEVLSVMADNVAIISPPHLLEGGCTYPGRHVLRPPAVRFLVSEDVFLAPTNSLTFLCCRLSSVFFLLQLFFLTSMIYLFCFLCTHLRSSSFPDMKFLLFFFCHSAEPSVVGPRTCWGKHCTSLLDTFFKH